MSVVEVNTKSELLYVHGFEICHICIHICTTYLLHLRVIICVYGYKYHILIYIDHIYNAVDFSVFTQTTLLWSYGYSPSQHEICGGTHTPHPLLHLVSRSLCPIVGDPAHTLQFFVTLFHPYIFSLIFHLSNRKLLNFLF